MRTVCTPQMLRKTICNVLKSMAEWEYASDTNYGAILVNVNARRRAHHTVHVYICCVPITVQSASSYRVARTAVLYVVFPFQVQCCANVVSGECSGRRAPSGAAADRATSIARGLNTSTNRLTHAIWLLAALVYRP